MNNQPTGNTMNIQQKNDDAKIQRMIRELQSDLCDLVESGDITETEANEWANMKADQWANGTS